jgi:hypothetical protein
MCRVKKKSLIVNFNLMFNEKTYYADVTDLLQFTITVRKSRRQNQYTLHFVCEDGELFVSVDLHVYIYIYICWQQHPKRE